MADQRGADAALIAAGHWKNEFLRHFGGMNCEAGLRRFALPYRSCGVPTQRGQNVERARHHGPAAHVPAAEFAETLRHGRLPNPYALGDQ